MHRMSLDSTLHAGKSAQRKHRHMQHAMASRLASMFVMFRRE
jgi:hypothetical protein